MEIAGPESGTLDSMARDLPVAAIFISLDSLKRKKLAIDADVKQAVTSCLEALSIDLFYSSIHDSMAL